MANRLRQSKDKNKKTKKMNLRKERNFLDLPDSCVTVNKDLRRSSSNNTRFDLRKRAATVATPKFDLRKRIAAAVMEALMKLSGGKVRLG